MLFLPIPGAEDKKAHKNSALTAETAVQWRYLFNSCAFFLHTCRLQLPLSLGSVGPLPTALASTQAGARQTGVPSEFPSRDRGPGEFYKRLLRHLQSPSQICFRTPLPLRLERCCPPEHRSESGTAARRLGRLCCLFRDPNPFRKKPVLRSLSHCSPRCWRSW